MVVPLFHRETLPLFHREDPRKSRRSASVFIRAFKYLFYNLQRPSVILLPQFKRFFQPIELSCPSATTVSNTVTEGKGLISTTHKFEQKLRQELPWWIKNTNLQLEILFKICVTDSSPGQRPVRANS